MIEMLRKPKPLLILITMAMALSGCGLRDRRAPSGGELTEADAQACFADLREKSVRFSPLPDKDFGGGCRTIDTVKLMDFGTPTTNLGAMTCPVAANFTAWARYAVRPAARQYLGTEVVRIETFGTYNCRNIGGGESGRLSEHGLGNAVDISAFILSDGRKITVLDGWRGSSDEQAFLRRLHESACRRFTTVLGPDYNNAHANHFHFDMAQRRFGSFCR